MAPALTPSGIKQEPLTIQKHRQDILQHLQQAGSLDKYQEIINSIEDLTKLKLIADILNELSKHNLLKIVDDTLLKFSAASLTDIKELVSKQSFLSFLTKMNLLNNAQDSLAVIKDLLTANNPYLKETYTLLQTLEKSDVIFQSNFKRFFKALIKQKHKIPDLTKAVKSLRYCPEILTETYINTLLESNENLRQLSGFLVDIHLSSTSHREDLIQIITPGNIPEVAKQLFYALDDNTQRIIIRILSYINELVDFNILEAVCRLPEKQLYLLMDRLELLFFKKSFDITAFASTLTDADLAVIAIEMLAIDNKLYKNLPKQQATALGSHSDDAERVNHATKRLKLLEEKFGQQLAQENSTEFSAEKLDQVETQIKEKLLRTIKANAGVNSEISDFLTEDNILLIAAAPQDDTILARCRELFISNEDKAQVAWRAYDPDPKFISDPWPKLLIEPPSTYNSVYTTREAIAGLGQEAPTPHNVSLYVRKSAALCFFATQDQNIDGYDLCLMSELPEDGPQKNKIYLGKSDANKMKYVVIDPRGTKVEGLLDITIADELTKEILNRKRTEILKNTSEKNHTSLEQDENIKKAKQEDMWQDFFINIAESERAHSDSDKDNVLQYRDIPSCFPGTLSRLSQSVNKHQDFISYDEKSVEEEIHTAVQTYIDRKLRKALDQTPPLVNKALLYHSLIMLGLDSAKEVIRNPLSVLSTLYENFDSATSENQEKLIQKHTQARMQFLSNLTAKSDDPDNPGIITYVKDHLKTHNLTTEEDATVAYLINREVASISTLGLTITPKQQEAIKVDKESLELELTDGKLKQITIAKPRIEAQKSSQAEILALIEKFKQLEDTALSIVITDPALRKEIIEERFAIEGIKTKMSPLAIEESLKCRDNLEVLTSLPETEINNIFDQNIKAVDLAQQITAAVKKIEYIDPEAKKTLLEKAHFRTANEQQASSYEQLNKTDKYGNTELMRALQDHDDQKLKELMGSNFTDLNINEKNKYGYTALMLAIKQGYLEIALKLLQQGAAADITHADGTTVLMDAIKYGYSDFALELLTRNAAINAENEHKETALLFAAQNHDFNVIKELLKKTDVSQDYLGIYTTFRIAAETGHVEIVKELLKQTVDKQQYKNVQAEAFRIAAETGHVEIVKELSTQIVNATLDKYLLLYALKIAAQNGHLEVVKELLDQAASVNIQNEDLFSAFDTVDKELHPEIALELAQKLIRRLPTKMTRFTDKEQLKIACRLTLWAIKEDHFNVVQELLNKGSWLAYKEERQYYTTGHRALELAIQRNRSEIALKLLRLGVKLDYTKDFELLKKAIINNEPLIILALIKQESKATIQGEYGIKALLLATAHGRLDVVVKELLNRGVAVEGQDGEGNTALMLAIKHGHLEIVQELLKKETKPRNTVSIKNNEQKTALDLAIASGNNPITLELIFHELNIAIQNKDFSKITQLLEIEQFKSLLTTKEQVKVLSKENRQTLNKLLKYYNDNKSTILDHEKKFALIAVLLKVAFFTDNPKTYNSIQQDYSKLVIQFPNLVDSTFKTKTEIEEFIKFVRDNYPTMFPNYAGKLSTLQSQFAKFICISDDKVVTLDPNTTNAAHPIPRVTPQEQETDNTPHQAPKEAWLDDGKRHNR